MKQVKQALILAGGHGTRMSRELNPKGCKSLIEYAGQSMLGHLVDALLEGGIYSMVFATNEHSDKEVKNIISKKNIKHSTVIVSDGKYRGVAYEIRHLLEDRFLMVCGHHPISVTHVKNMLGSSKTYQNVISAYDNNSYTMDKDKRIIRSEEGFKFTDRNKEIIPENHVYMRNPYIINKEIIESVHHDRYRQTFSYYLFQSNLNGETLGVVQANMPPEFDYDHEFERTRTFLEHVI